MYWLYGIDTVLRIAAALLFLFVAVPAMTWPRPATFTRLDWFFFNLGTGIVILTLAGQFFTLFNIAGPLTWLLLIAAMVILGRARRAGQPPLRWLRDAWRGTVLWTLHLLDGRTSIRRRVARLFRRNGTRVRETLVEHRNATLAWSAIVAAAAFTRFYRPFSTANLGYSDTYVHLYLMRLLDEGRQVDPAWGPYPRGMHFLLLAIERLTNVEPILMMNFFGAFSGVLLTLSSAYVARRITQSTTAALVAGLLFATMIGGARQYFALGGSVSGTSRGEAKLLLDKPYDELVATAGEFDVLLTAFQRQTSTLPQELAIVLLLPAALFMLDWLRTRDRWRLAGYIACTAAIAAIHSGVLVPLVALCAAAAIAYVLAGSSLSGSSLSGSSLSGSSPSESSLSGSSPSGAPGSQPGASRRSSMRRAESPALQKETISAGPVRAILHAAGFGALAVALGSTWMLGFLRYSNLAARTEVDVGRNVGGTALYYFPFLRSFSGDMTGEETAYMTLTPFLIAIVIAAVLLAIASLRLREPAALWIALGTIFFIVTHAASVLGIPEIVEVRRNVTWLALTIAVLAGVVIAAATARLPRRVSAVAPALAVVLWIATTPNLFADSMRARLLDYSGYGATTYAVLRISQRLEPFTWTLVSYGQEYPMVLGRGFHLNGVDFLEEYDPTEKPLRIPTPHVFIAVEKTPHRFQINNWTARFERAAVEERLQTWCILYGMTHRDIRVFMDEEHVRVYEIRKPEQVTEGRR